MPIMPSWKWPLLLGSLLTGTSIAPLLAEIQKTEKRPGNPYPLEVCIVSGEDLGSMGEPVVLRHEGREIRFCCDGCLPKFKRAASRYLEKLDARIAADQRPHYPLKTCVVSGGALDSSGMQAGEWVRDNRLVRLCSKRCRKEFLASPDRFLKKLDAAVIAAGRKSYRLDRCPVSGKSLGAMGEPHDHVLAGRLVRLCCPGCRKKADRDAARILAALRTSKGGKAPEARGGKPGGTPATGHHKH